jgi:long-subunit fatty acid transport protein
MKKHVRCAVLAAVATAMMLAAPFAARSQILAGLSIERLGALSTTGTGARPFAMGGAYTAAGDDVFSLLYNPAGLAEMRSGEVSIGLHQRSDEITNTYQGLSAAQSSSHTSLGHIAAAYPLPTERGNLVLGFGVFQAGTSNLESVKNAYLSEIPAAVENRFIQSGTIYQYHFGLGVDLSPRISLGASLVLWDESIDSEEGIDYADADSSAFWTDNVTMDLDGVSFNVGLLMRISDVVRAGFSFTSPAWLTYRGEGVTTYVGDYAGGGGWTTDPYRALIDEKYTLPMRFTGGLAITAGPLMLAADLSYCDYSQTEYNGLAITSELDPGMDRVLDATLDFRIGAEATLPQAPVRFRAGFAYVPLEVSTVEAVAYIADDTPSAIIADFEAERERTFFTFGVGGTIDRVLSLDLGVAFGGWEKVTEGGAGNLLTQERSTTEVVLSGTYRF